MKTIEIFFVRQDIIDARVSALCFLDPGLIKNYKQININTLDTPIRSNEEFLGLLESNCRKAFEIEDSIQILLTEVDFFKNIKDRDSDFIASFVGSNWLPKAFSGSGASLAPSRTNDTRLADWALLAAVVVAGILSVGLFALAVIKTIYT